MYDLLGALSDCPKTPEVDSNVTLGALSARPKTPKLKIKSDTKYGWSPFETSPQAKRYMWHTDSITGKASKTSHTISINGTTMLQFRVSTPVQPVRPKPC